MKKFKDNLFIIVGAIICIALMVLAFCYEFFDLVNSFKISYLFKGVGYLSCVVIFILLCDFFNEKFAGSKYCYGKTIMCSLILVSLSFLAI